MLRLEVLHKFSAYLVVVWMCLHTFYCCQSSWFWTHVKPSISFNSALFLFKDCYSPVIKRGNGKSSSMEVLMGKSLVAMFDYQGVTYLFPNDVSPKHIQPSLSCKTHLVMGYIPWIISQSAPLISLGLPWFTTWFLWLHQSTRFANRRCSLAHMVGPWRMPSTRGTAQALGPWLKCGSTSWEKDTLIAEPSWKRPQRLIVV